MKKILITFLSVISLFSISDDSVEMETVEIIGNKDEVSGSASVITNEDLELFEYTDIHKILSNVPGVNFRPEEGYGLRPNISIRGLTSRKPDNISGWQETGKTKGAT